MSAPLVTVAIETVTSREGGNEEPLADGLVATLAALDAQTYPQESIERIVVLDGEVPVAQRAELARRFPGVRLVDCAARNYFEAKNAGARAASGELVALLDGDCEPDHGWLAALTARMIPGVTAIAGKTRYSGGSRAERIFSIPDFAYVMDEGDGRASGININNVLFRRESLLAFPFEPRIARNGGCYFLYHQLRAAGAVMLYEPDACVRHGNDVAALGFMRKHFDRGYDSVSIYRLDRAHILRGTRLFEQLGPLALAGFALRRMKIDWGRLIRHRRQMGIRLRTLPLYLAVAVFLRLVELCGALAALLRSPAHPPAEPVRS